MSRLICLLAAVFVISTPALGEEGNCTVAILGDSLFLRGTENIYRIGP